MLRQSRLNGQYKLQLIFNSMSIINQFSDKCIVLAVDENHEIADWLRLCTIVYTLNQYGS